MSRATTRTSTSVNARAGFVALAPAVARFRLLMQLMRTRRPVPTIVAGGPRKRITGAISRSRFEVPAARRPLLNRGQVGAGELSVAEPQLEPRQ